MDVVDFAAEHLTVSFTDLQRVFIQVYSPVVQRRHPGPVRFISNRMGWISPSCLQCETAKFACGHG